MQLTFDEHVDILDVKCIAESTNGYKLAPGIYGTSDVSLMLKSFIPNKEKVSITIDDIRLRSNLSN